MCGNSTIQGIATDLEWTPCETYHKEPQILPGPNFLSCKCLTGMENSDVFFKYQCETTIFLQPKHVCSASRKFSVRTIKKTHSKGKLVHSLHSSHKHPALCGGMEFGLLT